MTTHQEILASLAPESQQGIKEKTERLKQGMAKGELIDLGQSEPVTINIDTGVLTWLRQTYYEN